MPQEHAAVSEDDSLPSQLSSRTAPILRMPAISEQIKLRTNRKTSFRPVRPHRLMEGEATMIALKEHLEIITFLALTFSVRRPSSGPCGSSFPPHPDLFLSGLRSSPNVLVH